jgi:hypothetical protein
MIARHVLVIGAMAGTVACDSENDPVVVNDTPPVTMRAAWQAALAATPVWPSLAGTAQVSDFGPYFIIEMGITGARPATVYSWRIYRGTCASVVVAADQHSSVQAYPNLTTDANGAVSVSRTISGPLDLSAQYHIRVSTVAAPIAVVGCGSLARG